MSMWLPALLFMVNLVGPVSKPEQPKASLSAEVTHPSLAAGCWYIQVQGSTSKSSEAWLEIVETDGGLEGRVTVMPVIMADPVTVAFADGVVTVRYPNLDVEWTWPVRHPSNATLRQNGMSVPSTAQRVSRDAFDKSTKFGERPQDPQPPFPYKVREVSVPVPGTSVVLAGTIVLPAHAKRSPGVVFISGSGPQDRDETIMGHRPFAVIADHLARNGIASIRVDDRGVAKSTGSAAQTTATTRVEDTLAVLRFFKRSAGVKADKIGLLGHSEGGPVAAATAKQEPAAFVVMLAGPGMPLEELLPLQKEAVLRAAGMDEAQARVEAQALAALLAASKGLSEERIAEVAERVLQEHKPKQQKLAREIEVRVAAKQLSDRWLQSYLVADPVGAIDELRVPTLAIYGELDTQVPAKPNEAALRTRVRNNPAASIEIMPKMNHMLQPATTGSFDEYGQITQTVDVALLSRLDAWINTTVGSSKQKKRAR